MDEPTGVNYYYTPDFSSRGIKRGWPEGPGVEVEDHELGRQGTGMRGTGLKC